MPPKKIKTPEPKSDKESDKESDEESKQQSDEESDEESELTNEDFGEDESLDDEELDDEFDEENEDDDIIDDTATEADSEVAMSDDQNSTALTTDDVNIDEISQRLDQSLSTTDGFEHVYHTGDSRSTSFIMTQAEYSAVSGKYAELIAKTGMTLLDDENIQNEDVINLADRSIKEKRCPIKIKRQIYIDYENKQIHFDIFKVSEMTYNEQLIG